MVRIREVRACLGSFGKYSPWDRSPGKEPTHSFTEHLVFPVPPDPLQEVATLAVLHDDEQLPGLSDGHCVQDLHNMTVINLGLNLDLWWKTQINSEL